MPLSIKNIEMNSFTAWKSSSGSLNLNSRWNWFRRRHSVQGSSKQLFLDSREIRKPFRIHAKMSSFRKLGTTTEPIDYRRMRRALCRVKNNPWSDSVNFQQKYIPCAETIIQSKKNLNNRFNSINHAHGKHSHRNCPTMEHQTVNYFQSRVIFITNSLKYSGVDIIPPNSGVDQSLNQVPFIPIQQRVRHKVTKLKRFNYRINRLKDSILQTKDKLSQLASDAEISVNHCWLVMTNWVDCLRICKAFFLWISRASQRQMKLQPLWRIPKTKILFYFIRSSMRRVHYGFHNPTLAQIN